MSYHQRHGLKPSCDSVLLDYDRYEYGRVVG